MQLWFGRTANARFAARGVALLVWLLTAGRGSPAELLGPPVPIPVTLPNGVGLSPYDIANGDFDGDGSLDLLILNAYSPNGMVVLNGNGDGTFRPTPAVTAGSGGNRAVVADLNGDGKSDVVAFDNFATAFVYLSNGDGTFRLGGTLRGDLFPYSLSLGDVNGDGRIDIVRTVQEFNPIISAVVRLGNGDGTFQPPLAYPIQPPGPYSQGSSSIALADLDNDGRPDLVGLFSPLYVMPGNGDGSFRPARTLIPGLPFNGAIESADFNGDGFPDLAMFSAGPGFSQLGVLLGSPRGPVGRPILTTTGDRVVGQAIADFNGDGRPDIALLYTASGSGGDHTRIGLLLGNGDGTFQPEQTYLLDPSPYVYGYHMAVGDFDGDGKPDVVLGASNGLSIMLNQSPDYLTTIAAPGAAGAGATVRVSVHPSVPTNAPPTVTVNGACVPVGTVTMTPGADPGTFIGTYSVPAGASDCGVTFSSSSAPAAGRAVQGFAHLLVDRTPPVTQSSLVGTRANDGTYSTWVDVTLTSADATSGVKTTYYGLDNPACAPSSLVACSVYTAPFTVMNPGLHTMTSFSQDQAGNTEAANAQTITIQATPALAAGMAFSAELDYPATSNGAYPIKPAIGDFNEDGNLDVLGWGPIWLGNGDGTFRSGAPVPIVDSNIAAVGDFNRDGHLDLAYPDFSTGDVKLLLGKGDGTFVASPLSFPTGTQAIAIATGDLNGDGNLDLLVDHGEDPLGHGVVSVLLGNGDGTFRPRIDSPLGTMPDGMAVADFDGDGRPDLSVGYDSSKLVSVLLGNGDGTFRPRVDYSVLTSGVIAVGDFNHDGKPDVVSGGSYSGDVSVLLNRGDGTLLPYVRYAASSVESYSNTITDIAVGDFNNDGMVDLAVRVDRYDGMTGQSLNLLSGKGDGTFVPGQSYEVLWSSGILVGDFNKDGRPDLVGAQTSVLRENLNRSPAYLTVTPSAGAIRAGAPVTLTVSSPTPLAAPPNLHLSGACVADTALPTSPAAAPNTYSALYTAPATVADCALSVRATATTQAGRPSSGVGTLRIDSTPPTTRLLYDGTRSPNGWFTTPVTVSRVVDDATPGAVTFFSLDDPSCSPGATAGCSVYTQPVTLNAEGVHTLYYFSQDPAGNTELQRSSPPLHIDRTRPVVRDLTATLNEDASQAIGLLGSDPGGDPLTYSILQPPSHGTLSAPNGGQVVYTPQPLYFGPDSFSYRATDGALLSRSATVTLTVQHVNHPPVAHDGAVGTFRDLSTAVALSASDLDNDPLTYAIVTPPAHGTLTGAAPNLTYTPAAGYSGPDAFTFRVNDGSADSSVATVSIAVTTPLVTVGGGTVAPGEAIVVPVAVTEAVPSVAALDITLQATAPGGAPALVPTIDLADGVSDWQVIRDPIDPGHVVIANRTGIAGPAALLLLTLQASPSAPVGTVYTISAASAQLSDQQAGQRAIASLVAPGRITVVPCAPRQQGDVNGNGRIDLGDAIDTLRIYALGLPAANECARQAADVNCDGTINLQDAFLLLERVALNKPFPACR